MALSVICNYLHARAIEAVSLGLATAGKVPRERRSVTLIDSEPAMRVGYHEHRKCVRPLGTECLAFWDMPAIFRGQYCRWPGRPLSWRVLRPGDSNAHAERALRRTGRRHGNWLGQRAARQTSGWARVVDPPLLRRRTRRVAAPLSVGKLLGSDQQIVPMRDVLARDSRAYGLPFCTSRRTRSTTRAKPA